MDKLQELKGINLNDETFQVCDYSGDTVQEVLSKFYTRINELIKSQNEVIDLSEYLVNEGLKKEVADRIQAMFESGELTEILGQELINSVNTQVSSISQDITDFKKNINDKVDYNYGVMEERDNEINDKIRGQNDKIDYNYGVWEDKFNNIDNIVNDKINAALQGLHDKIDWNYGDLENKINDKINEFSKGINDKIDYNYMIMEEKDNGLNDKIDYNYGLTEDSINRLRESLKNFTGEADVSKPGIATRIAIDSGHGDGDPGATFVPNSTEAIKCREIVDKCIEILKDNGCTNVLDVQKDVSPTPGESINQNLNARVKKVNNWGADVCVSVHMNSNDGTPGSGTETYVIATGGQGEQYANRINSKVVNAIGTTNRGVKIGNFAIIRDTNCPACLVETLFCNNTNDTEKFDAYKIALAIAEGILNRSLSGDYPTIGQNYLNGKISKEGMRLIKSWEGFSENPYMDAVGYNTVGYGLTSKYRPNEYELMKPFPTSEEKATVYLISSVESDYAKTVFDYISNKGKLDVLNQNRFDALVSIAYNKGANGLVNSSLMAAILEDPTSDKVKSLMLDYQVLPGTSAESGLRSRRQDEYGVYNGIPSTRKIGIFNGQAATGKYITENNGYGYIPMELI